MDAAKSKLWSHQSAAITAVIEALKAKDRAQIVLACGTGKTRIGIECARELGARKLIWLAPTIELLRQTGQTASVEFPKHKSIYVASKGPKTSDLQIVTNLEEEIASLIEKRTILFSTYSSFPRLVAALRLAKVEADLLIADEAHRGAGDSGRLFSYWNRPEVPTKRRLLMTATPRLFTPTPGDHKVLSMDDVVEFGSVVFQYSFGEAVQDGIICPVKVLVPIVDGNGSLEGIAAAIQEARTSLELRRIMTFHRTVREARRLTNLLNERGIYSTHVNGGMSHELIRKATEELRNKPDVVITNARVFGEGVDVPNLDAVCFGDFKTSVVDITQNVGRVVRSTPGKSMGYVMLPPTIKAHEDQEFDFRTYGHLWSILENLTQDTVAVDDRRKLRASLQVKIIGPKSNKKSAALEESFINSIRLKQVDISAEAWLSNLNSLIDYVRGGSPPTGLGSPFRNWFSNYSSAYKSGRLDGWRRERFSALLAEIEKLEQRRYQECQDYVTSLESGGKAVAVLTSRILDNRNKKGYAALYRRMKSAQLEKKNSIHQKVRAFIEGYRQGKITDRSIYIALSNGKAYLDFLSEFRSIREDRKTNLESKRAQVRAMLETGVSKKRISEELGVSPNTIRAWASQYRFKAT